jgi:hypothetical protein
MRLCAGWILRFRHSLSMPMTEMSGRGATKAPKAGLGRNGRDKRDDQARQGRLKDEEGQPLRPVG